MSPISRRKVVRLLLDHGAIIDKDVMEDAIEVGDEEIVSMLLEWSKQFGMSNDYYNYCGDWDDGSNDIVYCGWMGR
jgi:hypothetical protein